MSNNQFYTGSICLSDLISQAKEKHSAFSKSEKNGKIYANIKVWINEEKDKFGKIGSIQLNAKKDSCEEKIYIGNLEIPEKREKPLSNRDTERMDIDDIF